ncbi:RNA polymerase sigma factor [Acidicapsa ligni]|uniref:RNA polymerase sigma factor n=1 Tax=Acidicapsa ligni TaxID=542300 RepID=UPI0021DFAAAF|nr:hypothetical protein [Acidicapsa ligni]
MERYYDQLQSWALGLTRGDKDIAFDIVHNLYLYIRLAKPDLSRVVSLDNYLYKCLRHIHLAHLSESSRRAGRQIPIVEMDSLELAAWTHSDSYVLGHQNELRRICQYVVWRKQQSKSASFFILRFFHDYHPQQTAEIANLPLSVVRQKLSRMRSEIQEHLQTPGDQQAVRISSEEMPWVSRSWLEFYRELRETIIRSRTGYCLEEEALLAPYQALIPKAIPGPQLSHIVSCERCLSIIDRHFRRPTHGAGELQETISGVKKQDAGRSGGNIRSLTHRELARIVSRHYDDVYQHCPRVLSVVVDGKIVASHHVDARRSVQSVRIERPENVSGVEIYTEQDVRLMLVLVEDLPPQGPSSRTEHIELSDGRWLEMKFIFDSAGLDCEVTYFDPLLSIETSLGVQTSKDSGEAESSRLLPMAPWMGPQAGTQIQPLQKGRRTSQAPRIPLLDRLAAWWSHLNFKAKGMPIFDIDPFFAGAVICAVASVVCLVFWTNQQPHISPSALLKHAEEWDAAGHAEPGVIYQKVRITTKKSSLERSVERAIYRDAQGHRRPRHKQLAPEDEQLRYKLAAAGVDWDAPLSALTYQGWHDRQQISSDRVIRTGKNLLTLTTTSAAPDADVLQESLTVRANDFHPVSRTVELRDYGTVEIAELNYDVLPWSMANPDWFEPVASDTVRRPVVHESPAFHVAPQLTEMQLDEAELEARVVLNRLQVDMGRHIDVIRSSDGVHVIGIVDNAEQKRQMQAQLMIVPHVIAAFSTIQELDTSLTANAISSVQARSVTAVSGDSSVERYFAERGMQRSLVLPLTRRLVDNAFIANHESKTVADLMRRFAANQALTPAARMALSELIIHHKATLLDALEEEQQRLVDLKLISDISVSSGSIQGDPTTLEAAAQRNFALCVELTALDAVQPRPAQEIAPQIAEAISGIRANALRISAASVLAPSEPNKAEIVNQNK